MLIGTQKMKDVAKQLVVLSELKRSLCLPKSDQDLIVILVRHFNVNFLPIVKFRKTVLRRTSTDFAALSMLY